MRRRALVAVVAALAVAGCGDSPEDEARDAGQEIGEAAFAVFSSTSPDQAEAALADLRDEVAELDPDVSERIADQVDVQRATLKDAVEDARAETDPEQARDDLRAAVQDMQAQAAAFRDGENAIANEFWRGVQEGYEDGD